MGALEFTGEARGEVAINGSGRERNSRGQPRGHRSEVEINGRLPAGASICAHEVRFGPDAVFAGPVTVRADGEPETAPGVEASLINYTPREEPRCD